MLLNISGFNGFLAWCSNEWMMSCQHSECSQWSETYQSTDIPKVSFSRKTLLIFPAHIYLFLWFYSQQATEYSYLILLLLYMQIFLSVLLHTSEEEEPHHPSIEYLPSYLAQSYIHLERDKIWGNQLDGSHRGDRVFTGISLRQGIWKVCSPRLSD